MSVSEDAEEVYNLIHSSVGESARLYEMRQALGWDEWSETRVLAALKVLVGSKPKRVRRRTLKDGLVWRTKW
jgi:hypothetical protein